MSAVHAVGTCQVPKLGNWCIERKWRNASFAAASLVVSTASFILVRGDSVRGC